MPALRLRIAAVAALVTAASCTPGPGAEEAAEADDRSVSATVDASPGLAVGKPVELAEAGALNPTVAVDPASGAMYAAWAWDIPLPDDVLALDRDQWPEILQEVVVAASGDGGRTWAEPVVASAPGMSVRSMAASPTQVAVGPGGEVYVLFLENRRQDLADFDYGLSTVWLSRSDDGGKSFVAPVAVTGDGVTAGTSTEMATLLAAPDGDLFVSFLDYREAIEAALDEQDGQRAGHGERGLVPAAAQLRVTRSADRGRSWSPGVRIARTMSDCSGTQVAQSGADGPLLVTARSEWLEVNGSHEPVRDPVLAVSADDGATFSEPRKLHDDRFKTSGCPDVAAGLSAGAGGTVHAAWYTGAVGGPGFYHAISGDDGRTWSRPRPLLTDDYVPAGDIRLAVDQEGAAWMAVEDRRDAQEDRLQVLRVDAGGAVDASRVWPGRSPYLAAAADGVIVAWGVPAADDIVGSAHVARVRYRPQAGSDKQ